jgi:hypothetical protein
LFPPDLENGLEDNLNHQVTSVLSPKIYPGLAQEVSTTKRGSFNLIGHLTVKQQHSFFFLVLSKWQVSVYYSNVFLISKLFNSTKSFLFLLGQAVKVVEFLMFSLLTILNARIRILLRFVMGGQLLKITNA